MSPAGGITQFTAGITASAKANDIAAGSDGALWFTEPNRAALGRVTTNGFITETTTGITAASQPWSIVAGPDGNLWFTEQHKGVARITTSGEVTEYPQSLGDNEGPIAIASGPDGNIWFSDGRNKVTKIGTGAPAALQSAPAISGAHLAGKPELCAGAQFSTWGGVQPSITSISWTFNGAAATAGDTYVPPGPGQLSCTVTALYAAQKVPVTTSSSVVAIGAAPPKIRRTTCKIKKVKKKITLSCSTKRVDASTKLAKPKKSNSVTLKFKRGKKTYKVKAIQTSKQIQLLAPAALPKGTYKVKISGQTVKLKLGQGFAGGNMPVSHLAVRKTATSTLRPWRISRLSVREPRFSCRWLGGFWSATRWEAGRGGRSSPLYHCLSFAHLDARPRNMSAVR